MHFEYGKYYHLYNRSNNKELLFRSRDNYYYFLEKFRTYIGPYCAVLASCLMPTHFHFLIRIETEDSLMMSK
jgi:REP element-mobilizing transposase RayT